MHRLTKKRSAKAGLPPGTPVHIGTKKAGKTKIEIFNYDESRHTENVYDSLGACPLVKDVPGVTWINVDGVNEVALLEKLGGCFGLHPLVMEDIMNTDQRPKMEDYGEYLYIVLKMLNPNGNASGKAEDIVTEQVSIILGRNFVISFQEQERPGDVFDTIRDRIRAGKGRIRGLGADYLAYSLMDAIIDNYFILLERLGEDLETVEEELVKDPSPDTLRVIHTLKRDMIFLRRSVWPLREVIGALERGESPLVKGSTGIYLRDIYDHTIQVIDTIETFRDMLSGMLDIYLSSISNRMNEVMKVLTIIATFFIPMTFVAGVYGMNFKFMPELEWHLGYPFFWFIILAIGVIMMVYFRKKKWF